MFNPMSLLRLIGRRPKPTLERPERLSLPKKAKRHKQASLWQFPKRAHASVVKRRHRRNELAKASRGQKRRSWHRGMHPTER